ARRAHDRDELALLDLHRHAAQGVHLNVAQRVDLHHVANADYRGHARSCCFVSHRVGPGRRPGPTRSLYFPYRRTGAPTPGPPKPPGPPGPAPWMFGARVCVLGMTACSPSDTPSVISLFWSLPSPRRITRVSILPSSVSTSTTWSRPERRIARFGTISASAFWA